MPGQPLIRFTASGTEPERETVARWCQKGKIGGAKRGGGKERAGKIACRSRESRPTTRRSEALTIAIITLRATHKNATACPTLERLLVYTDMGNEASRGGVPALSPEEEAELEREMEEDAGGAGATDAHLVSGPDYMPGR